MRVDIIRSGAPCGFDNGDDMQCNSSILSYRGFTIWIRTTGSVTRALKTWSAAYQLCLNNVALHQYVEVACLHSSAKAAAAKAVRFAKIDIDTRLEVGISLRAGRHSAVTERVSSVWLLRLAESRHRKI
ncbi:MAG: hypothetical protein V4633_15335 [Pseudomonadota bacterium]